jgi:hypothetical protein
VEVMVREPVSWGSQLGALVLVTLRVQGGKQAGGRWLSEVQHV